MKTDFKSAFKGIVPTPGREVLNEIAFRQTTRRPQKKESPPKPSKLWTPSH